MEPTFVIGQIIGFVATFFSVLTFQLKTHKQIILAQIATSGIFIIHYLLLGAYAGAAINAVAVVRNIIYYHKDKRIFSSVWWTVGFAVLIGVIGCSFVFTEGYFALFFMVGMVLNTVSFSMTQPQKVRVFILTSSPLLLIYNILTGSWGGAINEILAEISTVVGLIRYRKKIHSK